MEKWSRRGTERGEREEDYSKILILGDPGKRHLGIFILFLQLSGLKLGQNKKKLKGENKSERIHS